MSNFIERWLSRRRLEALRANRKKHPMDYVLMRDHLVTYGKSQYTRYSAVEGMTTPFVSSFKNAGEMINFTYYAIDTLRSKGRFGDPRMKKVYEGDLRETFLDNWLIGDPEDVYDAPDFHNQLTININHIVESLNGLRANGDRFTSYYTRYLTRLFEDVNRWLLVVDHVGDTQWQMRNHATL